jgi:hypothetical protein
MKIVSFLALVIAVLCGTVVAQTPRPACPHRPVEIALTAARVHAHPVLDVALFCTFTAPDGRTKTVRGFWDGDRTYRVRFAPDAPGAWTYRTHASDTLDDGLHGRSGAIVVGQPCSDAPFDVHGLPRVAPNGRYLMHADGTPWFYLSDTAWEIVWKTRMDEFRIYLADRAAKRFNAVQMCAISHQLNGPRGMPNQKGQTTFLDTTLLLPNPEYFRLLDTIVTMLNDSGMVAVISPIWAWVAEPHRDNPLYDARFFNADEAEAFATYIAARYAGHNVIWIAGGDKGCDTDEQRSYWTRFARALQAADGGSHLTTLHPNGGSASYTYFDSTATWLDFHMYQSSHTLFNISWWDLARKGWERTPAKPLLDGEAVYEDLYENFWLYDEHSDTTGFRWFTADDLRRPRYESILSGALAGLSYGASGVYQWNVERLPEPTKHPRKEVLDALHFPGSSHMQVIRDVMTSLDWWAFTPAPGTWRREPGMESISSAENDRFIVSYFPRGVSPAIYAYDGSPTRYYTWVHPRTGRRNWSAAGYDLFPLDGRCEKPDTNDWLFVGTVDAANLERLPMVDTSTNIEVPAAPVILSLHPHPITTHVDLTMQARPQSAPVTLQIVDLLGREVHRESVTLSSAGGAHLRIFTRGWTPGLHILQIEGASDARRLPFLVLH